LDVEGYEAQVLRGASRLLSEKRIGSIIAEADGHGRRYGEGCGEVDQLLKASGYEEDPILTVRGNSGGNCVVFHWPGRSI
jgi:hypothetical protein